MGVYIKGLNLPKEKDSHYMMAILPNGTGHYTLVANNTSYRDLKFVEEGEVEVIEIPTPHGRLIDADKLEKKKYHSDITHENAVAVAEIHWLPTVIEAEE